MYRILVPSFGEIVEINKRIEDGRFIDQTGLETTLDRLASIRVSGNRKKDTVKAAAILWFETISKHPFVDGNKRTATEIVKSFLKLNEFKLDAPDNGLVYISLQIANKDIDLNKLIEWLNGRIKAEI